VLPLQQYLQQLHKERRIPILFYDMTGEKKARITAALAEKRENESKEKADADEVKKEYEELSEEISEYTNLPNF